MGVYSTPFIRGCGVPNLTSVDSNAEWVKKCTLKRNHTSFVCDIEAGQHFADYITDCDLVFVDCRPREERPIAVKAAFGRTRFVVEHDSEAWPRERIWDRTLDWTYLEGREDTSGVYKLVQMEFFDPHTAVWTNDEDAYQRLLVFKAEQEA
jgi:hypothetical protein